MEDAALRSLLTMLITSLCLIASCVLALCWRVFRSTRAPKPPRSPPRTPDSEHPSLARLETLAADQAELFSAVGKLSTTVKRLSSRAGMQDFREKERGDSNSAPPVGASKTELLRHYGMAGKVGPEFARAQQQLELKNNTEH